jgi:hypothetical protein
MLIGCGTINSTLVSLMTSASCCATAQIGSSAQIGADEAGAKQVCAPEISTHELRSGQIGLSKIGLTQVRAAEVHAAQHGLAEIGFDRWILFAPLIPNLNALPEQQEVFHPCHGSLPP